MNSHWKINSRRSIRGSSTTLKTGSARVHVAAIVNHFDSLENENSRTDSVSPNRDLAAEPDSRSREYSVCGWQRVMLTFGIALNVVLLLWSYWPALADLVATWIYQADYAHGFFVLPLALFFLYCRRDSFPGWRPGVGWLGIALLVVSLGLRLIGWRYYLSSLECLSIVCWVAGATWLLGGWAVLKWSWPTIAFLVFMVPLPYRLEVFLGFPLQGLATVLSSWFLQLLGEPAVVEGHTIYLDGSSLEVAQACSGLRIFMTSLALGSAFAIMCQRHWIDSIILILAAIPIAVIANSMRIVMTGFLLRYASASLSTSLIHDLSGWMMLPLTAALFGALIWYLNALLPMVGFEYENIQKTSNNKPVPVESLP